MAIAVDSSSPALVAQTSIVTTVTTASFTPPADAMLVACAFCSQNGSGTMTFNMSDNQSGTWTTDLVRNAADSGAYASAAGIYHRASPGVAMTVTATVVNSFLPTLKVLVLTGVDMASPVGSSAKQGSTSTSFATTGYANARASSIGIAVACGSTANGITSNDATASYAGPASNGHYGVAAYKLPLGAAGATTTHHFESSGSPGIHVVQVEFKAAPPARGGDMLPFFAPMHNDDELAARRLERRRSGLYVPPARHLVRAA